MEKIVIVLAILLVYRFCLTVDAQYTYANRGCSGENFNYTSGSVYEKNLNRLFGNLTSETTSRKFYNNSIGGGSNQVYSLFQCRNDVSFDICSACVENATQRIIEVCPYYGEAVVWYYECMLRYANRYIFSISDTYPSAYAWNSNNVSDFNTFGPKLASAMNGVIKNASSTPLRFASAEANFSLFEQVYSFAQCTPDIDPSSCNSCLKRAFSEMIQCCNASIYAIVFFPSCQLRYDTTAPFIYTDLPLAPPPPPTPPVIDPASQTSNTKSTLAPGIIAAIAVSVSVGLLVLSALLWLCLFRKKPKEASSGVPSTSPRELPDGSGSIGDIEFMQYDLATLKLATRDFSAENKLGEGGFGIVYKGTLENGHQLAIKRLSDTSRQGTKEFMAESQFLAKLQHKNLVSLVGFCSEGDEKLLVYEFMPNSSLDRFLFDPRKRPLLDWATRNKIIMGIARGLQYLHEDSRLTIIHRDLKPSNVLLDKDMNPKIADFGMAKLFEVEQKFGQTNRIIGTQGYMAPEYLMTGEYSDKSDVYSFGIMLLEIVSGQKNRLLNMSPRNEDLPLHAWKLWKEGRCFDIADPALYNIYSSNDVIRCIQIGLLCVQVNAEQRPTMPYVVLMLSGLIDLPLPLAPTLSSHQFSMTNSYSVDPETDSDQPSGKTVTWRAELDQDLYPRPR
ncbi:cysteine-rich receptor-like protein kinase 25 [Silene latifolia]|uniref:cysteine-rich receptor-like protein kinase 25 n=1 Tax=Silene latifolia TaxID=37657 RepID=UPI003D76C27B